MQIHIFTWQKMLVIPLLPQGWDTLTGDRRVEELARMLAGLEDTETGRAHAQELLLKAQDERAAF